MRTFDQDLLRLVKAGEIEESEALSVASSPHDFKLLLAGAGSRGHATWPARPKPSSVLRTPLAGGPAVCEHVFVHGRLRPDPPLSAAGGAGGQARAAGGARRARARGRARAAGGRGVGAGRGVRRRAGDAGGGGARALPGAAARAARPRGRAGPVGRGARPPRGDRRGARVRARRRGVLRGRRPDRHPRRPARGGPRRPPARALGRTVRLGAAPSRFASYAAALQSRPRRPPVGRAGRAQVAGFLAPLPVALLRTRPELQALPEVLERLGIRTLGRAGRAAVAGGGRALRPSRAARARPRPGARHPARAAPAARAGDASGSPLPEAASGQQLERALELLVARLLARRERRGRTLRALALSARFVAGGTWRLPLVLRAPSADPARLRLLLAPRLAELPAPGRGAARSRWSRSARRHATRAR